jgi:hypothetical protein
MHCLFINLDGATGRRARLEADFASAAPSHWSLIRIAALGPSEVSQIDGRCTPAEKGCYLSHLKALEHALDLPGDVLIVEDDAAFSARGLRLIDEVASTRGWDLLYTDVSVRDFPRMVELARLWPKLTAQGRFAMMDAAALQFVGAGAYIIAPGSAANILGALRVERIDVPIDIRLRDACRTGKLRGRIAFPFLTTTSSDGDVSQIAPEAPNGLEAGVNAFRRLMFVDADLSECAQETGRLSACVSEHARLCGATFAAMLGE